MDGDPLADPPLIDIVAQFGDHSGNLATKNSRQFHFNRKSRFLGPEVEPVQTACFDLNKDFIGSQHWLGKIDQLKGARNTVGDKLNRAHRRIEKDQRTENKPA